MKSFASKYLSVNTYDILKAAIAAGFYALLDSIVTYFNNKHNLPSAPEAKAMLIQSGIVFIAYIKVKAFTNSNGKLFTPEVKPVADIPVQANQ